MNYFQVHIECSPRKIIFGDINKSKEIKRFEIIQRIFSDCN